MTTTTIQNVSPEISLMVSRTLVGFEVQKDNGTATSWSVQPYCADITDPLVFGIQKAFRTKGESNDRLVLEAIKLLEAIENTGAYPTASRLLTVVIESLKIEYTRLASKFSKLA